MTFQVLPPLSEIDYAALKADVFARGVMVPVEYDQDGNIIDGHHRVRVCEELGIKEWPKIVRSYEDDAAKRTQARKLNIARRHLDQAAKRSLIESELAERPEVSDRAIAKDLGVDHKTVAATRGANGEIPHKTDRKEASGRNARGRKPQLKAISLPGDDGRDAIKTAASKNHSQEKEQRREDRRQEVAELAAMLDTSRKTHDLYNEPCINALKGDASSIDWVITDPPYPKEYLHLYNGLGQVADHALKPGGSLLCMVGQSYLPDVIAMLSHHLNYHWTLGYLTPGGQAVQIFQRKINTFWKPVLWFVKGEYSGDWIGDVVKSSPNDNDKRFHEWGQSESGFSDLMSRFVKPGDAVLDPFMGAGTTGVIALKLGARFVGFDNDLDAFNEACTVNPHDCFWSPDGVRQERTGWRDQAISARHRAWGFNCPCVDLDFLVAEYNMGKPVALIEYKHHHARRPTLAHATYRALIHLSDNYTDGPLPFVVAFYWPDIWAFRITPVNEIARRHFGDDQIFCELEFVRKLYLMRRLVLAKELEGKLCTEFPPPESEAA